MMVSYLALFLFGALASSAPTTTKTSLASRQDTETCTQASLKRTEWEVKDFKYHSSIIFTVPSHRVASGTVNFTLTNLALPFTMGCSAVSDQMSDFFYGNRWYQCSGPSGNIAQFQFDKSSGRVDIQQSWQCTDELDGANFRAQGSTNINLGCETQKWQNPNWTSTSLFSTEYTDCKMSDFTIKPSEISATSK